MKINLLLWPPRRRPNRTGSRTAPKPFVNDRQLLLIEDLFPYPPVSRLGGRPSMPPRACLEGALWVLKTGARLQDLRERYPSPTTCWRRLRDWTRIGTFVQDWRRLLGQLDGLKQIDGSNGKLNGP